MKKKITMNMKVLLCLLLTLLCHDVYSQLAPFTITVTSTPQTCLGNGGLNIVVNNASAGASLEFEVYLLPDTVQPVTTVTTTAVAGLVSGSYQVVATQSLNGQSNNAQGTAVIEDNSSIFAFTTAVVNASCTQGGSITVNVYSGTGAQYEIISGPQTFPPQASNVFAGLLAGQYQLRAFDTCGDAFVTTVTVSEQSSQVMVYAPQLVTGGEMPSCGTIMVNSYFYIEPSVGQMVYPINVLYKVYPPGGGIPVLINDSLESGDANSVSLETEIPFYNGEVYSIDVIMTDGCGNTFSRLDNMVYAAFDFSVYRYSGGCNNFYIEGLLSNYTMPCTVSFNSSPAGFDPSQFNVSYPLVNQPNIYFGLADNPLPAGNYAITVTDACGKTATKNFTIGEGGNPEVNVYPDGSCFYNISIKIPNLRNIVEANVVSAPESYPFSLPQNVVSYASGGYLSMPGCMPGDYVFNIVDQCGNEYTINVSVIGTNNQFSVQQGSGCIPGRGSVMLYVNNSQLSSVKITTAPQGFNWLLPLDVSDNIKNGSFYMNMLVEGEYIFEGLDTCGNTITGSVTVMAYNPAENPVEIIYNCGSFDIDLHDNTSSQQSYYLQKFNEVSGQWVHPVSGIENTGLMLTNNTVTYNLVYKGKFRIIRQAYYYANGSDSGAPQSKCENEVFIFEFQDRPVILGAYAFPCSNGLSEFIIDAVGTPPLTYEITQKNEEPYVVNNNTNFVFTQLESSIYNFRVTDDCGNIVNIKYDITSLKPLEILQKGFCEGEDSSLYTKSYSFLTYEWWKEGASENILSTSYSLDIPLFNGEEDGGKYFLKIVSTKPGSCIDTVIEYDLKMPAPAFSGDDASITLCDSQSFTDLSIYLSEIHDEGGVWIDTDGTGRLAGSMLNLNGAEAGIYHFAYVITKCGMPDEAVITIDYKGSDSFEPELAQDCLDNKHLLLLENADNIPGAVVTWSGPGGFSAEGTPVDITGALPGKYIALVENASGCTSQASINVEAGFCNLPKGVSPNGDGKNDTFDLTNLNVAKLEIFNRYGFIIYKASNYKDEWYGQTDSGKVLPTGVYYYAATLQNGKQLTGWVYLQNQE